MRGRQRGNNLPQDQKQTIKVGDSLSKATRNAAYQPGIVLGVPADSSGRRRVSKSTVTKIRAGQEAASAASDRRPRPWMLDGDSVVKETDALGRQVNAAHV